MFFFSFFAVVFFSFSFCFNKCFKGFKTPINSERIRELLAMKGNLKLDFKRLMLSETARTSEVMNSRIVKNFYWTFGKT